MGIDTSIAQTLKVSDKDIAYDAAVKRVLSEKIILAWILKTCVHEYKDCDVLEIAEKYIESEPQISSVSILPNETNKSLIRGANTEDSSINEGTILYDIRFYATAPKSEGLMSLIINIEAQNDYYPGYSLITRGIYHCSRMISSQYNIDFSHAKYQEIKKVYSIWICRNPPKKRENTITRYRFREENIIGEVKEKEAYYDLATIIIVCLGENGDNRHSELLNLLDILLSQRIEPNIKKEILERDFDIKMSQKLESEVSEMCNLSKGLIEEGIAQGKLMGIAEGRLKGLTEGKLEGIAETQLESIKNIMETLGLTAKQAMEALKIDQEKQAVYLKIINTN